MPSGSPAFEIQSKDESQVLQYIPSINKKRQDSRVQDFIIQLSILIHITIFNPFQLFLGH